MNNSYLAICLTIYLMLTTFSNHVLSEESNFAFDQAIVTAEKRMESMQGLSQSVLAFTGQAIDQANIDSFIELGNYSPNVTVSKNEGFKNIISIRGVGNEANQNATANPSVSYHFDGIYVASPYSLDTDFYDLERIEVVRGPQATVFGQNATGGAINIITKEPHSNSFEAGGDVTLGDYSLIRTRGFINAPINDSMALRVSASLYQHDGFSENISLDQELDDKDSLSGRIRFLWQASDSVTIHLSAQHYNEDKNGAAQKSPLDTLSDERKLRQDSKSKYDLESSIYSFRAIWDLDPFEVNFASSYQSDEIEIRRDNDRTDINTLAPFTLMPSYFNPEIEKQDTITHELFFVSNDLLFDKIDWMAGIFYLDTEVDIEIREELDLNFDGSFEPYSVQDVLDGTAEVGFISDSKPKRESYSVYGRGTYNISDEVRLIAGLRYTEDKVNSKVNNFFGRFGTEIIKADTDKVTGRVAMEYDLSIDSMLYAFYTESFKPGGSNLTFGRESDIAPIIVNPAYDDETVQAFEIGYKADLMDGTVRFNSAVFLYQYENLQFHSADPEVFQGGVNNIPESEILGAEIEILAKLSDSLMTDFKIGLLDTEITKSYLALDNKSADAAASSLIPVYGLFSDEVQVARSTAIADVKGNELPKAPDLTVNWSLYYNRPLADWGEITTILNYQYRGDMQQRVFNLDDTDDIDSYDIFNITFSLAPNTASWELDLSVLNITDEDGVNAQFTDSFGVSATSYELIAPRQFLAKLKFEF